MSRKVQTPKQTSYQDRDVSFAAVQITASMKDACLAWMNTAVEDLEEHLTSLLSESYRITLKYDSSTFAYSCSISQQDEKHRNFGIILMSWSDDPVEAMMLGLYKALVLFPTDTFPVNETRNRWG